VAVLNTKGEDSPDMGAHGAHFTGIHHFGFEVDDLDAACQQLEGAHGQRLTGKDHIDRTMAAGGHANFEMKWSGPDGGVIDISHTGGEGTDEGGRSGMAGTKHTALPKKEPATAPEFYKSAFALKELRRHNGNVFLTDGYIHIAVLQTKGEE